MSVPSTLTHVYAPCLQTCCLADFQIRKRPNKGRSADWKSAIQQVWKPALRHRICARKDLGRRLLAQGGLEDFAGGVAGQGGHEDDFARHFVISQALADELQ